MIQQIVNIPWQHNNAHRNYPFHDKATLVDVDGNEMDTDVITDCHIWAPGDLAQPIMVSSVGISEHLTSVTFSLVSNTFQPLAGLTVAGGIVPGRNYRISPFIPGVEGWVTFGAGAIKSQQHYRFPYAVGDSVQKSELLPRVSRTYDVSGFVTSIRKAGRADGMVNLVSLISSSPEQLVIEKATRTVADVGEVDAIVFRLNSQITGVSIYSRFLSECDKTPDSNTCRKPHITAINEATPDCNGAITLIFEEIIDVDTGAIIVPTLDTDAIGGGHLKINSVLGMVPMCDRTVPDLVNSLSRCDECESFSNPGPFDDYTPRF